MKAISLSKVAILGMVVISLLLGACAPQAATPATTPAPAVTAKPAPAASSAPASTPTAAAVASPAAQKSGPPVKVRLGSMTSVSDSGLLIAREKGYFQEQSLDVEYIPFASGNDMVAPLGTGQLDVGGGSPGVALHNAIARDVDIKIVADKGSTPKGQGFEAIIVRKDLWDAGVRTPADFKGRRTSISSLGGNTAETALANALRPAGIKPRELDLVALAHPDAVTALAGKSVDIAVTIEPYVTQIVESGLGVIYKRTDEMTPGHQIAVILYSGKFAKESPEAATRFMMAYLKGVRDYNDAFIKKDPLKKADVVSILAKATTVKDAALYDKMAVPGLNPNGETNKASMADDQEYYIQAGLQKDRIDMDKIVDPSWAKAAVEKLGVYK
ncbi:MAG: ABC transporter substrate-binding protein [Dehalococcoidia bacterium]|nr:ABC transporter substrate-binding protein [Dehalococcoidia bacterium]